MSNMATVRANLRSVAGEIDREVNLQPMVREIQWTRNFWVELQPMVEEINWAENLLRLRNVCACGMERMQ